MHGYNIHLEQSLPVRGIALQKVEKKWCIIEKRATSNGLEIYKESGTRSAVAPSCL